MSSLRDASKEVETLLSWGLDYYGRGQTKEAVACWRRVLALSPGHSQATDYLESAGTGAAIEDEPARPAPEPRITPAPPSMSLRSAMTSTPPRGSEVRVGLALTPPRGSEVRTGLALTPPRGSDARPQLRAASVVMGSPAPPPLGAMRAPGSISAFSAMFLSPEARRWSAAGPTPIPPSARPIDARSSPTPVPPSGSGVGAAGSLVRTVLVADSNTTTASLTRTLARVALGKDAVYVSVVTGPEAIEAAGLKRPDLCVLEFMLSGSNGIETLQKIRERLGTVVPAVLTVQKIERDFVKHRLPERTAIVVRPFDRGTLEAALRSLFGE